MIFKT